MAPGRQDGHFGAPPVPASAGGGHVNEARTEPAFAADAETVLNELDDRVCRIFVAVRASPGWRLLSSVGSPPEAVAAFLRELLASIAHCQNHAAEAWLCVCDRLPQHETRLQQILGAHTAERQAHEARARGRFAGLGYSAAERGPPGPATFAAIAVSMRIARTEAPLGYLGVDYLFDRLTELTVGTVLATVSRRPLPPEVSPVASGLGAADTGHAAALRHTIREIATRRPESGTAMLRCSDYFGRVYPSPIWDEAYRRAMGEGY
jgi:hypothetical protein